MPGGGTKQVRSGKLLQLAKQWEQGADKLKQLGLDPEKVELAAAILQDCAQQLRESIEGGKGE